MQKGVFAGLATLDIVQQVAAYPEEGEKVDSLGTFMAAGGPASNAAVAFAHAYRSPALLGYGVDSTYQAVLVTRIGDDAAGRLAETDLSESGVSVSKMPCARPTTVSSIIVSSDGERTIASPADGGDDRCSETSRANVSALLDGAGILCLDGYEDDIALPLARKARELEIPVLLDVGREREHSDEFVSASDIVIASSSYKGGDFEAAARHAEDLGVRFFAMTRGGDPVLYRADGEVGRMPVPQIRTVDTLATGDFFHGAFAKAIAGKPLRLSSFLLALEAAAKIASESAKTFGSRGWLDRI